MHTSNVEEVERQIASEKLQLPHPLLLLTEDGALNGSK